MSRLATLDLEKTEASINLHKAAPDLLAVCADLVESAEYWGEYDVPIGIVDRLNAAIAKAGGTALRTPESCHWQKGDWPKLQKRQISVNDIKTLPNDGTRPHYPSHNASHCHTMLKGASALPYPPRLNPASTAWSAPYAETPGPAGR